MRIDEKNLTITLSPKEKDSSGGQHVGTTDSSVRVELQGSISITCGIHRSQIKNKRLAIMLIELAIDDF